MNLKKNNLALSITEANKKTYQEYTQNFSTFRQPVNDNYYRNIDYNNSDTSYLKVRHEIGKKIHDKWLKVPDRLKTERKYQRIKRQVIRAVKNLSRL